MSDDTLLPVPGSTSESESQYTLAQRIRRAASPEEVNEGFTINAEAYAAALAGTPGTNASGYTGGVKNDVDKPDMSLLPRGPLEREAQVLMHGARKYGRNNWRSGFDHTRLIAAALRHLLAYADGEDLDPETGLCHIDHASCMIHFLSELRFTHPELDDRGLKNGADVQSAYKVDMMGNPIARGVEDTG